MQGMWENVCYKSDKAQEFKEMVVRAVVKEGVGVSRIFKLSPNTVIVD